LVGFDFLADCFFERKTGELLAGFVSLNRKRQLAVKQAAGNSGFDDM